MSIATLKTKVKKLGQDLASQGFVHFGSYLIKRTRSDIDHFVELQPGHGHLDKKFTCNLAWKFNVEGIPGGRTFHHAIRIGCILDGADVWFSHEPKEALDESYDRLRRTLEIYALPFLDSIDSIEKLVSKYEMSTTAPTDAMPSVNGLRLYFGEDLGWQHCLLGFCYKKLGHVENANQHLRAVLEEHSGETYDFIIQRKAACEKALAELNN